MIKVNKADDFLRELKQTGQIKYFSGLDYDKSIKNMNKEMKKVRRDFLVKNAKSEIGARSTYVFINK